MCEKDRKIKVNRIKCKFCGDIIESKHRHDFVECKCKRVFVDGGTDYLRRGFPKEIIWPDDAYEELSEYEEE